MLAVLCGGLLIGRLGWEVLQWRWSLLSPEEKQRLWSLERWQTSFSQLGATSGRLVTVIGETGTSLVGALQRPTTVKAGRSKRWVRAEPTPTTTAAATDNTAEPEAASPETAEPEATVVVSSFQEIDGLIQAASGQAG
jgi:hypothetical protein